MISSFYKYCPIYQDNLFEKEFSIVNLLSNQVTFSTRNNFNDLFDSKVNFIRPCRKDMKDLSLKLKTQMRHKFKEAFFGGNWEHKIEKFENEIINELDNYLYYCVTDINNSNLMWSHYASSHKGFCIEWDSKMIQAQKVHYQSNIANVRLLELIKIHCGLGNRSDVGEQVWLALRTKLKEWEYESEYRFQISNKMEHLVTKREENFVLVKYQPEWIKSIIWGCRTTEKSKEYIMSNLASNVKYREAYEGESSILIRDIK